MRLIWVSAAVVLAVGCGDPEPTFPGSGGAGSTSSTSSSMACTPGQQVSCACPGGGEGIQVCVADGSAYGACEGCGGQGGAGGSGTTSTSSSGGNGGAGGGPECTAPGDCPGMDGECASRTCDAGVCGMVYQLPGTPLSQQTPGDCATAVCDGSGGTTTSPDAGDIEDDNNQCTADTCSASGPMHDPLPTGTTCTQGGGHLCQGAMCVAYIPVQCKVGNTTYVGCDGFAHPGQTITWGGANGGACNGVATDVGYCSPGTACAASIGGPVMLGTCQ